MADIEERIISENERAYSYKSRHFFAGRCQGTSGMWHVDEVDQAEISGSKTIARVLLWRNTRKLKHEIAKLVDRDSKLDRLLKEAANHVMTPREAWLQRVSFVYGNASLSNPQITREMVEKRITETHGPCPEE